jgi:glycosyltransferase involved in cell wall biosynthesis
VAEAGIGHAVTLTGHSDRAAVYMAAGDLFLLPSRWEALPISIVEAFRAGLPVVATDAGGVRELVDDAVGAVTAIGDLDALTQAVLNLCGDDDLRGRLSAAAFARSAEDRFAPQHINEIFERTYRDVIGAGNV